MVYDPKKYWGKRGWTYQGQDVKDELKMLAKCVRRVQPESILEVGSGYGRIYRHFRQSGYTGPITLCDFVDSFRYHCEEVVGILPDRWDGQTLPYGDCSFDMVVSFSVLHHVPVADLGRVFSEHVRVLKNWFYIAVGLPRQSEGSNILHDYNPLFEKHKLRIIKKRGFKRRKIDWLLAKE